ncbi:MAG: ABC transporter ATP-binding protein [Chloroflexi bacterium]|nr:ABC transporter ATP-binding protein [Chloroflexota bacterium]
MSDVRRSVSAEVCPPSLISGSLASRMNDIRKLFSFIKPYWKGAVLSLILLSSLVVFDLSIPRLIQRIIDQGINQQDQSVVLSTAALMIAISVMSTLIAIGNNIFSIRVGEGVARDLREALFLKIQTFSFGNLDRQRTGQLIVRLTSDVNMFKILTQMSLRIGTRAPLMMVGSLILMINTSASLALSILPLLLVTSALIVFFVLKMEPLFLTVQQKLDRLNTVLQENIAGARVVKAYVRSDFEDERFEVANEKVCILRTCADAVRQHRHGDRHLVGWGTGHPGRDVDRPNRGFYQLSALDHDAADHDDHAVEHMGGGDRLGRSHQRSAGYRAGSAG